MQWRFDSLMITLVLVASAVLNSAPLHDAGVAHGSRGRRTFFAATAIRTRSLGQRHGKKKGNRGATMAVSRQERRPATQEEEKEQIERALYRVCESEHKLFRVQVAVSLMFFHGFVAPNTDWILEKIGSSESLSKEAFHRIWNLAGELLTASFGKPAEVFHAIFYVQPHAKLFHVTRLLYIRAYI